MAVGDAAPSRGRERQGRYAVGGFDWFGNPTVAKREGKKVLLSAAGGLLPDIDVPLRARRAGPGHPRGEYPGRCPGLVHHPGNPADYYGRTGRVGPGRRRPPALARRDGAGPVGLACPYSGGVRRGRPRGVLATLPDPPLVYSKRGPARGWWPPWAHAFAVVLGRSTRRFRRTLLLAQQPGAQTRPADPNRAALHQPTGRLGTGHRRGWPP